MKQGALVLYIDNAGGGFHQLVREEAQACNFMTVFGPLKHHLYSNKNFDTKRFGFTPCLETKVSVHLWRKPHSNNPCRINQLHTSECEITVNVYNVPVPHTPVPKGAVFSEAPDNAFAPASRNLGTSSISSLDSTNFENTVPEVLSNRASNRSIESLCPFPQRTTVSLVSDVNPVRKVPAVPTVNPVKKVPTDQNLFADWTRKLLWGAFKALASRVVEEALNISVSEVCGGFHQAQEGRSSHFTPSNALHDFSVARDYFFEISLSDWN